MKLLTRFAEFRNQRLFEHHVKAIRTTPPARLGGSGLTVLSMVQHRDVDAYLLAAKSFLCRVPAERVVLVADPTLTDDDKRLMAAHIPGIEFRPALGARRPGVPHGGCWERLLSIAEEVQRAYVVQLDADTVTTGPVPEVQSRIRKGQAFLLPGERGVSIMTCNEAARSAKAALSRSNHIQVLAESKLDFPGNDAWHYARACAGFTGFPRGSFDLATVQALCDRMSQTVGERWSEWGSEQFTSNLIAASQPGAVVLPHPKYCNADRATPETTFLHFIGYTRFTSSRYADCARLLSERLR